VGIGLGIERMKDSVVPYRENWEHIADELARLELIVRAHLVRAGVPSPETGPEPLRGLYLSEAEVQRLLQPPTGEVAERARDLLAQAETLDATISQRREASLAAGVPLRLPLLAQLFGLTPWEERLLLMCLAPEVDQRYERFYAYLNDDLMRKGVTAHLALALLFEHPADRIQARGLFASGSRLFRAGLLGFADDGVAASGHPGRALRLDGRIADFLFGLDHLPGPLETFARLVLPDASRREEGAARLADAIRDHMTARQPERLLVHLTGPVGVGKRALARSVCELLGTGVLEIDLDELASLGGGFEPLLRLAVREALLRPAAIYLAGFDRLSGASQIPEAREARAAHPEPSWLEAAARAVEDFSWLTFLAGERPFAPNGRWQNHILLRVPLSVPDENARTALWTEALAEFGVELPAQEVDTLAGRYRFTPGQMRDALRAARDAARLRPAERSTIAVGDVVRASRQRLGPLLEGMAQRIEVRYGWEDIVLPRNALGQLHDLCGEVRHRRRVYGEWGFGEKHARGKGVAALFSGPSGTGKTMAAEIVAGDLELDLYRIDLSVVVSKYIGETEKNLARIFAEAERGCAVLFFDEADALFGKRSEVKDAHDRYANIEISYLLQRMEIYEGVVILATNLKKNMDEAFLRRLQYTIEFPFPDEAQRRKIWRGLFPLRAPRAADMDFGFLAGHLALAGGNIKNVVLHAAFLAAADGGVIGMPHLMRAAKREYDKIGRLASENDFGPFWYLIKAGEP
jgi:SpoVK/Ycf46/Vps4 family AAA+-type ATPase